MWLPDQLPVYIKHPSKCQIVSSEGNKIYASRVSENVPFFKSNFSFIPGLPAVPGDEDYSFEEAMNEPEPARVDEVRDVAPEDPLTCSRSC